MLSLSLMANRDWPPSPRSTSLFHHYTRPPRLRQDGAFARGTRPAPAPPRRSLCPWHPPAPGAPGRAVVPWDGRLSRETRGNGTFPLGPLRPVGLGDSITYGERHPPLFPKLQFLPHAKKSLEGTAGE